jgi:putative ubiquitin-RnfH superfamily antitoxin RatB of RatAB toxin-antitoxin module
MVDVPACGAHACLVAIDTPAGPWQCEVPLASGMTVADGLAKARARALGTGQGVAGAAGLQGVEWDSGPVGIWGQRCGRERLLAPGDRVELYLALPGDPRERRRARAGRQRAALRRRAP